MVLDRQVQVQTRAQQPVPTASPAARHTAESVTMASRRQALLMSRQNQESDRGEVLERLLAQSRQDANDAAGALGDRELEIEQAKRTVEQLVGELAAGRERCAASDQQVSN